MAMSAATTLTCTSVAMLQQQEGALGVEQGVPATVVMLVGTTGESSGAKPSAEAAHLAKLGADTCAASTPHSWTWLCTSSQAYAGAGAGATGSTGIPTVGEGVARGVAESGGGGWLVTVGTGVTAGVTRGEGGGGGGGAGLPVTAGVTDGVAKGEGGGGGGV